jgi:glycosyltransferase involved in cell wall biosynthesis
VRTKIKNKLRRVAKRVLGISDAARVAGVSEAAPVLTTWGGYTRDAMALADVIDCTLEDLARPQQHPERVRAALNGRTANWYLPAFDNPYYGGVMTILRFAAYMQARGVHQRILICGPADTRAIHDMIVKPFPVLAGAEVLQLDSVAAIEAIPPSDYSFATLWTTAYVLLRVGNTGLKFYFMQDYEPLFYPAGSTYAQAELPYRFGFIGIANTKSIRDAYVNEYGGTAHTLTPCVDPKVFHPSDTPRVDAPRQLFYYARPGTPRNGFELAAAALRRLKGRMGTDVRILCAGANWNPAEYGLEGVVEPLGLLPYEATGDLYRRCHVGLVMMMTRHPSYLPFELMACGCLVVSNRNAANTWFLRDGENCLLSPPSASALAQTLERALRDWQDFDQLRTMAAEEIVRAHSSWDDELAKAFGFVTSFAPVPA